MAAQQRSGASWERVLAAIEADAARAASLLVADDALVAAGIEYDGQDAPPAEPDTVDVPATWRLPSTESAPSKSGAASAARSSFATPTPTPTATATSAPLPSQATAPIVTGLHAKQDVELPDPAELPPMTPEVRDRLEQLQRRIALLQSELAGAMAETEDILSRPTPRRAAPAIQAELVDRRL